MTVAGRAPSEASAAPIHAPPSARRAAWIARLVLPSASRAGAAWHVLLWIAGFAAAISTVVILAWPFVDARFDYLVLDDGQSHALRVFLLEHLLRRGVLFPRWWPDLAMGYGYPLFNYYAPGTYYLAVLVHFLGVPVYQTLKWVAIGSVITGATGAFVLGSVLFRQPLAGAIIAGAFVLAPYPFATTLYNRGAFPEAWGLGLLPWLLTFSWLAVKRRSPAWLLVLATLTAATMVLHNLSALINTGIALLWIAGAAWGLPRGARVAGALRGISGVTLGLGLCAFFWLPALAEQRHVYTEFAYLYDHHTYDRWLFEPFRVTENRVASVPGHNQPGQYRVTPGAPFDLNWLYPHAGRGVWGEPKPGLGQALLLIGAGAAAAVGWLERRPRRGLGDASDPASDGETRRDREAGNVAKARGLVLASVFVLAGLYFLNTEWSRRFWEVLPLLPSIQFPWRLWGPFGLLLAFVSAACFAWLARRGQQQWVLAALLTCFVGVNGIGLRPWVGQLRESPITPAWADRLHTLEQGGPLTAVTSTGEFLPRSVTFGHPLNLGHAQRKAFEAPYPSGGWIAGRVWPYWGNIHVEQVWETPQWTQARVSVSGGQPAELAFRTFLFPGWRAYVDGVVAPVRPAPFDPGLHLGHGFAIVQVPPGEHDVQLAFGSTMWRSLGTAITIGSITVFLLIATRSLTKRAAPAWFRRRLVASRVARALFRRSTTIVAVTGACWLLAVVALDLRAGWRAPGTISTATATVAVDVAERVRRQNDVQISSPSGDVMGGFVDVRPQEIGGHTRHWLYMHPPSEVRFQFAVPARAVFQTGLAVDPRGWDESNADGVRFIAEVQRASGAIHRLLDEVVWPQQIPDDRGWRFALVDLSDFTGETVTMILRTEGRDTPFFDWAGWGSPVVYVDRSARYPPSFGVSPAALSLPRG
jgi:hypothetical protein